MPTTIDSIQIEIQSSSANAASGIRDLAKSLGELKSSGTVNVAIKNLEKLSTSLKSFTDASKATSSIGRLVGALTKLKEVGSVSSVGNSLKKLTDGMRNLENVNAERIGPQIRKIVSAVEPLSSVKAGGLNTMVNALSKIGKVTAELDDDKIAAFANRIEKLNTALMPLSTKMTTIQTGLKGINSSARSAGESIKDMGEKVDGASVNFSSFIYIIQEAVQWFQAAINMVSNITGAAAEWDGIAARFGRGFGPQAKETYEWIQKLNEEMGLNVQMFMQYSSIYATMLTGFGVAHEDATKMALGYTELTYDIWAGYNDVYKSYAEAADAVKSAIAGEVEPIRRAGFTIVESTLEQTAANHGLEISLYNATEAEKSYLRYLTLVDQAHAQSLVGTYAKELNTAEGLTRTLSQQVKSLSQAFGSLLLPILVRVVPWVQAFVELLTEGVHWLAELLGVELQKVDWSGYNDGSTAIGGIADSANGATDALGSAAQAAKDLKKATLGIDELNVISPPTSTVGSAAGGTGVGSGFSDLGIDSLWDDTIFKDIGNQVDEIKEKLRDWMPVIATVTAALAGLRLTKLLKDIKDIKKLGFFTGLTGAAKDLKEYVKAVKEMAPQVGLFAAMFPKLSGWFSSIGSWFSGLGGWISSAAKAVGTFVGGFSAGTWAWIAAIIVAVAAAIYYMVTNWDEVTASVKKFYELNIVPKLEEIKKHFEKIKEAFAPLISVLQPVFDAIVNFFKSIDWDAVWNAIKRVFEALGEFVFATTAGGLAGAISVIASAIENIIQWLSGAIQTYAGVFEFVIALFTGGDIEAAAQKIFDGVKDVFGGFWGLVTGPIVDFVNGVIDWFTALFDVLVGHSIVPDLIDEVVACFLSLGSRIYKPLETFVEKVCNFFSNIWENLSGIFGSIGDAISDIWTKITGWFGGSKGKDSTYDVKVNVPDIKAKLSAAWSSAKTWWDDKKAKLKDYTPTIGSIYDKVKARWDSARDWWNNKKAKMKDYTPSIGSIYEKVYERWKNARDWWNNKKGSFKTYTPSIGSITEKLKSAWNSAKTWWNKNVKLSIPSMKFKVTYSAPESKTMKAIMNALDLPGWPKLSFAANGGIFDAGSLIWAGERGPEVMATAAGGKTGVMNVQQMQEAVYEGVYAAFMAAKGSSGGEGTPAFNLYLDGRQVTATVERRQKERGASIMGNQVYSY